MKGETLFTEEYEEDYDVCDEYDPERGWLLRIIFADTGPVRLVFRSFSAAYDWLVNFIRDNWYAETGLRDMPDDNIVLIDMFCRCGEHEWAIEECTVCF